jgi:hypothetical protein
MNYEQLKYTELANEFTKLHGKNITPEALMYRVKKKGLTKAQAVKLPLDERGKSSRRKKLRVGRRPRKERSAGLTYCYLHIDVAGTGAPPVVRYVGKGKEGRCLTFNKREKLHSDWIHAWFTDVDFGAIEMGVAPSKLRDLSWIDCSKRQKIIVSSNPFENAEREEARLINRYNTDAHDLFNRMLFTSDQRSISKGFQGRPSRKKQIAA